jgi:hypothetical protein
VDTVAPTSKVHPLPVNSPLDFPVSWSGQDDAGGSGLRYFDVYVSDNGGPFSVWPGLSQTTRTSAVFEGTLGHRYAFYTIATDNAGDVETKTLAEAQTQTPVFENATLSEAENTTAPPSLTISTLLGTHYGDADKTTRPGIAVTQLSGEGSWQYSTNGKSWTSIGGVGVTSALLLPAADKLRFLPAALWNGEADLLFAGWDGSQGSAGGRADTTNQGNGTPFSATAGEVAVIVTFAAHAPEWTAGSTTLTPVVPGSTGTGETVQAAFGAVFADANLFTTPAANQPAGIAVVGLTGTTSGTWEYELTGGSRFVPFPKVSASAALLLEANDRILFVPRSSAFTGMVSLTVNAWDGTKGSAGYADGGTANLSKKGSTGGTTPFGSNTLTGKLYFNHAPAQSPPPAGITLSAAENAPSKAVSVATLLNDASATDTDKNILGLALTEADGGGAGTWQYELPGGVWQNVPATLSDASVLLLPNKALLRFNPIVNHAGAATLSWDAWDGTQGTSGTAGFAIAGTGGATAFSSTSATATLTITPSQHPPAWSGGRGAALTPVLPGNSNPVGDTVASIFGAYFEAPGASVGIAVSGVSGTKNGQWQYSTDGGASWINLPSVSPSQVLLLSATDRIRFKPNAGFLGRVTLTAYAWDGGGGPGNTHGKTVRPHGSDFSNTALSATCLINTAPTLTA